MDRPVFILGSHKSGTSLLRSLLDGAPGLFVVPCEAHFFQYGGYWVDYALRRSLPVQMDLEDLVSSFTRLAEASNERTSQTSPADLTGLWDVEAFTTYLRAYGASRYETHGFRGFLDTYIEAIHVSLCGDVPKAPRFAEKSVENAEFASILAHLYPDACFIHIVRNPYATLVALRGHMGDKTFPFLGGALDALENSYYHLDTNSRWLRRYKVIRYEDLVTETQTIMQEIANFSHIEFTDTMLVPTVLGETWSGNSSTGDSFEGVSTDPLARWRQHIHPLETALVNATFSHVLRKHGYELRRTTGSPYLPCRRERPRTYLANRFLWHVKRRAGSYAFRANVVAD